VGFYDIFNGDADGLCALLQLRLDEPRASTLVTGVKRDTALVARAGAGAGDEVTVLDCAFGRNREAVGQALGRGARVRYFDHHEPGPVPEHPNLRAIIDTAPDVCTSLLVDRYLDGRQRAWAVVGAFGDNLAAAAGQAAARLQLAPERIALLRALGECLNYNAYGERIEDLHYHPADLFLTLRRYPDPYEFIVGEPVLDILRDAMADDLYRAGELAAAAEGGGWAAYVLPDAPWARRVSGPFANRLAQEAPERALAVLTERDGGYTVSVRAPMAAPAGAAGLCEQFGGGGRAGAGGVNLLPRSDFDRFVAALRAAYERGH